MNKKNKKPLLFSAIKYLLRLIYPKIQVLGFENLPKEPCIIVGNHAQLHGPIVCELYFPDNFYTWCASAMMRLKEVPSYAFTDFWSQKPKLLLPFFRILSYIIAPLSVLIFNNARTIAVYNDSRVLSTFKDSVEQLKQNNSLIIFPEHDEKKNNIIYDFQEGFVDTARLYYKRTGKEISFVPMYVAPKLKRVYLGRPIKFSSSVPITEERTRICNTLADEITDIARNLPEHTVIPYRNIPKRFYPKNTHKEIK